MNILSLKTDQPKAELYLRSTDGETTSVHWQAHRQLAETLQKQIKELLSAKNLEWKDINAMIVFKGPGSFTGLRIGISCANAIADSLRIPIVATSGEDWLQHGIALLESGANERIALPEYGGEVHTTTPRK